MSSRIDELQGLVHLLDHGKISESEYETLKSEILDVSSDTALPLEDAVKAAREGATGEALAGESSLLAAWFAYARQMPNPYLIALGAGILAALLSWRMWPLAWLSTILGVMALVVSKSREGRWMAWTGLVLGAFFVAINLLGGPVEQTVAAEPASSSNTAVPSTPPRDSLGIRFNTLAEEWNALELPPSINSPIRPTPEPGALDSFLHRFDGSAVLAGAYDPVGGYTYALLARADLYHDSVSNMYVHLCHLLHPGSQACLDAFIEENRMFGKRPLDFVDVSHDVRWEFESNEWRLTIADNVQTIRVQAPPGA